MSTNRKIATTIFTLVCVVILYTIIDVVKWQVLGLHHLPLTRLNYTTLGITMMFLVQSVIGLGIFKLTK